MSEPTGNGYGKPFVFAPPKSPEEIARDEVRKTMPNLRYQCSRDPRLKRHVGAKWLFDRLSDDSFMNIHGGDGFGKVYTSLIDLRRRYGHDEQTLARWTAILIETGWIWVHKSWPRWCFGITSVCRQPELFAPEYVRIMAKASGEQESESVNHCLDAGNDPSNKTAGHGFPPEKAKTANLGQNHHDPRLTNTQVAVGETAGRGGENRRSRFHQPQVAVGGTAGHGGENRKSWVGSTVSGGANKESPGSIGVSGGLDGEGSPPPDLEFQKWVYSLEGQFPSKLRRLAEDLKARFRAARSDNARKEWKRRIEAVEERLLGGKVPDAPKPAPVSASAPAPKEPTHEQILEGARYLVSIGKEQMMTEAQRAALKEAGA